ncbi:MAG: hypothetical protein ABFD80_05755, partial [Acidobacteriota bacterium]
VNASYAMAFALLKEQAEVWRTKTKAVFKGIELQAGAFIVKNGPQVRQALPAIAEKLNLAVLDVDDIGAVEKAPVKSPRIGLFQSWRGNMDEGWTRYAFDDMGIPYKTLHNDDIKGTKEKKVDLRPDYDVIIFADESANAIKGTRPGTGPGGTGGPGGDMPMGRMPMQDLPPEYEGGIGQEGVEALKAFVEKGGILVALNRASEFAITEFGAPARSALQGVDQTKFFCPTSIVRLLVDNETPIGYGLPREAGAVFARSLALDTYSPPFDWDRKVVAAYPDDNVLMSGWLLGEEYLARKAAVVDTNYKNGRIILIGIRCQNRAQTHGTYKFLLNALLYPGQ